MSEIDWSKAPEGATHVRLYNHGAIDWYKVIDGVLHYWNEDGYWDVSGYDALILVPDIQGRSSTWTGAGLPPVGTVCWVSRKSGQDSPYEGECTIVAHHMNGKNPVAVYVRGEPKGMYASIAMESCFSPLRTQEQIEAEEREKAIEEMIKVDRGTLSRTVFCGMLYDAGYRKQGEAK